MRIEVQCPAKVNPFLAVGPVDSHRYHPIRTVLQAVSLYDTLVIDSSGEPGFYCRDPDVPAANTVTKALRLVSEITTLPPLRLELTKRIPSQAGLGGGSSDAAGLLRNINRFLPAPIPADQLMDMAIAVGMDTAFFMIGGRCRGEHYGEVLTPMAVPDEWYVIVRPNIGCASGDTYRRLDELSYEFRDFPNGDEFYNDFERVAPCESLELIDRLLTLGCDRAGLTGSGSAVFGRVVTQEEGWRAAGDLGGQAFVALALPSFTPGA